MPGKLLEHGTIFATGYINNFIKPLVDMIGMLDAEVSPARLCIPVPRDNVSGQLFVDDFANTLNSLYLIEFEDANDSRGCCCDATKTRRQRIQFE